MGPAAPLGAIGLIEAAFLLVGVRHGLDKGDRAPFAAAVEVTVGVRDRALADAAVLPGDLPGLGLQAHQFSLIEAVDVLADRDHVAVVTLQLLARVELRRLEGSAGKADLVD